MQLALNHERPDRCPLQVGFTPEFAARLRPSLQLHERLEATLRQALRFALTQNAIAQDVDTAAQANLIMSWVNGRWHQFAKSGFKRDPTELWAKQWKQLMEGVLA